MPHAHDRFSVQDASAVLLEGARPGRSRPRSRLRVRRTRRADQLRTDEPHIDTPGLLPGARKRPQVSSGAELEAGEGQGGQPSHGHGRLASSR